MKKLFKSLILDEEGATVIEYVLLAALIAVVVIGSVRLIGQNADKTFNTVGTEIAK